MIENVLIVDVETTGLHPSRGSVMIELGALLYNVHHRTVIQTLASFFPSKTNEARHINLIDPEWTTAKMDSELFLDTFVNMALSASAIVAHNAQFDREFLRANIVPQHDFWRIPWVCTKKDFKWPVRLSRQRLQDVCVAMGVPYVDAHRSLTDCQFIADCFTQVVDLHLRLSQLINSY